MLRLPAAGGAGREGALECRHSRFLVNSCCRCAGVGCYGMLCTGRMLRCWLLLLLLRLWLGAVLRPAHPFCRARGSLSTARLALGLLAARACCCCLVPTSIHHQQRKRIHLARLLLWLHAECKHQQQQSVAVQTICNARKQSRFTAQKHLERQVQGNDAAGAGHTPQLPIMVFDSESSCDQEPVSFTAPLSQAMIDRHHQHCCPHRAA